MDSTRPAQLDYERRLFLLLKGLIDQPRPARRRWLEAQAADPVLVDEVWRMLDQDDEGFLAEPAIRILHRVRTGKLRRSRRS
jgi:hypothetical protein